MRILVTNDDGVHAAGLAFCGVRPGKRQRRAFEPAPREAADRRRHHLFLVHQLRQFRLSHRQQQLQFIGFDSEQALDLSGRLASFHFHGIRKQHLG